MMNGLAKPVKLLMVLCALTLVLTGCMRNKTEDTTQPMASSPVDFAPNVTDNAAMQGRQLNTEAPSAFDWQTRAAEVEASIAQLSEIESARVVVINETALVGVRFSPEYRGELTERIREMVASEVLKADAGISTVAVTAVEEDVKDVFDLAQRLLDGATPEEMKEDVQRIVRNVTTMR